MEIKIEEKPAFSCWVSYTLNKSAHIAQKLKSKYWKITHHYDLRVTKYAEESKQIDKENGNILWVDEINKYTKNVMVLFEEIEGDPR